MKKSKKVLLITFIVVLFLFIVGKIIIGNMVRNVQNISVSMPDISSGSAARVFKTGII